MQGSFFRGTTHTQDSRFGDKEKKLLLTLKFEPILDTRIDLKKVDLPVLEPWVDAQVTSILGIDDDVVSSMIISELEQYKNDGKSPNGKLIQIRVMGFLERSAAKFMVDLWKLLIEAQSSPHGIVSEEPSKHKLDELQSLFLFRTHSQPKSLIDQKKNELRAKEEEMTKIDIQRARLEEAKEKLREDQVKMRQIKRLFTDSERTDRSASPSRPQPPPAVSESSTKVAFKEDDLLKKERTPKQFEQQRERPSRGGVSPRRHKSRSRSPQRRRGADSKGKEERAVPAHNDRRDRKRSPSNSKENRERRGSRRSPDRSNNNRNRHGGRRTSRSASPKQRRTIKRSPSPSASPSSSSFFSNDRSSSSSPSPRHRQQRRN